MDGNLEHDKDEVDGVENHNQINFVTKYNRKIYLVRLKKYEMES